MEQHQKILQALADGSLKDGINESSALDIDVFEELINGGFVKAIDACTFDGREYLDPKITLAGRKYLNQLIADSSAKRTSWVRSTGKVTQYLAGFVAFVAAITTIVQFFHG